MRSIHQDGFNAFLAVCVLLFALVYFGSCAHTYATCHNGHVLKNAMDWPVCVRN